MDIASTLLHEAQRATGHDDFGDDSFREGLEILLRSAQSEAKLTERGVAIFHGQIIDLLSRRLEVEHWYEQHPEIDEQEITRPLIGLGLPRTGSTALHNLLGQDQSVRFIRNWENMLPCPPPELATAHSDPRIAEATRRSAAQDQLAPRIKSMLPMSAASPSECQNFMGYDFKSQLFQAWVQAPSYSHWLHYEADLVPTYTYVKRVLKLLQWRCPPTRWRLKNPSHMAFIGALDKVFPDAVYWMTHRDIASVIPSVSDLYFELGKALSDDVDKKYLGDLNIEWCDIGLRRLIAFRDAGREDRFFDIHFSDFQNDPLPQLAALYEWLGEPLTDDTRRRMTAWRESTPRDKHGAHEYSASDFGIDREQLRKQFRFYSDRFSVSA